MLTFVRHCIEKARTQIRANWSPRGCEVVMPYDLIVVGGGIAGASLAQRMAKNSARVLQKSISTVDFSKRCPRSKWIADACLEPPPFSRNPTAKLHRCGQTGAYRRFGDLRKAPKERDDGAKGGRPY